jgi:hypothetical protein
MKLFLSIAMLFTICSPLALASGGKSRCSKASRTVTFKCDAGPNDLQFIQSEIKFIFSHERSSADATGGYIRECHYDAKSFESLYTYKGKNEIATDVETLAKIRNLLVQDNPTFEVSIRGARLIETFEKTSTGYEDLEKPSLNLGLGYFRRSANPENLEANEARLVYSQDRLNSGMGDGYLMGQNCSLEISR